MEQLKIPKERIACLIGTKGETKKLIEKTTRTRIQISSEEGDIIIRSEDPIKAYLCKEIIKAIGRGFNPKIALSLTEEGNYLEIIEIKEFARKTKNDLSRLKSRLIGKKGKAREEIEKLSNTKLSVHGKTVCIIGKQEELMTARQAIIKLLQGAKHQNVYFYIKRHAARE
ncbi:MAG: KH domain-containing protein [Nanoarchaeota archaeon]|nr:KH domain-containing protein [Nanoarchaeota archaeon]